MHRLRQRYGGGLLDTRGGRATWKENLRMYCERDTTHVSKKIATLTSISLLVFVFVHVVALESLE